MIFGRWVVHEHDHIKSTAMIVARFYTRRAAQRFADRENTRVTLGHWWSRQVGLTVTGRDLGPTPRFEYTVGDTKGAKQ